MTPPTDPRQPDRWEHAVIAVARELWREEHALDRGLPGDPDFGSAEWVVHVSRARRLLEVGADAMNLTTRRTE